MSARGIRVGMVDDHQSPVWGIEAVLARHDDVEFAAYSDTVDGLLAMGRQLDVVLLDLRLTDGTTPRDNVTRLSEAGIGTVVYTSGEWPDLMRSAARAGVLGVVLKSAPEDEVVSALRQAAQGDVVLTTEWAAAVDSDPGLDAVALSPQLAKVLTLYASGETSVRVAHLMGLHPETVNDYLKRIRQKYMEAGRPANTKLDLFKRAVEDGWLPMPRRMD